VARALDETAGEHPVSASPRDVVAPHARGSALDADVRAEVEPVVRDDLGDVRVHTDADAAHAAGLLGARAFAEDRDIWLGPGESPADRALLAHELAHTAAGRPGIFLREATWLERRAWLSFFDHYLPRKFLNNYMDDTGNPITLTPQEMMDVNPIVDIRKSRGFKSELAALASDVASSGTTNARFINVTGLGQARTNGTLGNFTIHYSGALTVNPDGKWFFGGTMRFTDYWDFDPKPFGRSGRSTAGEVKTRVAAAGLPGSPFRINSIAAPLAQSGTDPRAVWAGGTPVNVPEKALRTGADIEVDAGAGAGVTGPVGADVGGETGAQSSEDLN
jgi:hypothetical protein